MSLDGWILLALRLLRAGATLAYIEQRFIVPDQSQIAELELLLANCLNEIKILTGKKTNYFWSLENKIDTIEKRIIKLEGEIKEVFRNPKRTL